MAPLELIAMCCAIQRLIAKAPLGLLVLCFAFQLAMGWETEGIGGANERKMTAVEEEC